MESNALFLDTSGWLALLNRGDRLHSEVAAIWRESFLLKTVVVVTDWVIAETGNSLARGSFRQVFIHSVRLMRESAEFRIVKIDEALIEKALILYEARPDKTLGLVDCASFVVMTEQGIRTALTNDRHFEQAGFQRLLM